MSNLDLDHCPGSDTRAADGPTPEARASARTSGAGPVPGWHPSRIVLRVVKGTLKWLALALGSGARGRACLPCQIGVVGLGPG